MGRSHRHDGALETARAQLKRGDALANADGQATLTAAVERWSHRLREKTPTEADLRGGAFEPLPLVDARGNPQLAGPGGKPLVAPRWLCHLLGLRHRSAHVVLLAPRPSDLVVLQVRARWKDTAPGALDTAAGGHVGVGRDPRAAALDELEEELGLVRESIDGPLHHLGSFFALDSSHARYRDAEIIDAYAGRLAANALARVAFRDGEVSRVVLAPPDECWRLLALGSRRVAAGARAVLPRALELVERGEL